MKKLSLQKISAYFLKKEAKKRWYIIEEISEKKNLFFIKREEKYVLFKGIDWGLTSKISREISVDKNISHILFKRNNINFPNYIVINKKELIDYNKIKKIGYPLVTKPLNWSLGRWVIININNQKDLEKAIKHSFNFDNKIIIQNFVEGKNLRILVINNKVFAGLERIRHHIIWDGESTLKELLQKENLNTRRWKNVLKSFLPLIEINEDLESFIKTQYKMTLSNIPKKNQKIFLKWNWYSKVIDITDTIEKKIKNICEKISKIFNLPIAWVDIIYNKKTKQYRVLEVNSQPWIKTHHLPMEWKSRNVAGAILDLYFK